MDAADRHPTKICTSCWTYVRRSTSAVPSSRLPETNIVQQSDWPLCRGDDCTLCARWKEEGQGGRRPKRKGGKRGRPPGSGACKLTSKAVDQQDEDLELLTGKLPLPSDPSLAARLQSFSHGMALLPERFVDLNDAETDMLCPVCKNVLDRPVAVPVPGCEHACCLECWEQWLAVSATCPVCRKDVALHELQPVNRYLWLHLSNKAIHRDYWDSGCAEVVSLSDLCQDAIIYRFGKVTKEPQTRADENRVNRWCNEISQIQQDALLMSSLLL